MNQFMNQSVIILTLFQNNEMKIITNIVAIHKISQLGRWPKGSKFDILAFRNSLELNQP